MIKIKKNCVVCNKSYEIIVSYKSKIELSRDTCSDKCRYKIVSSALSKPKKSYYCKCCNKEIVDWKSRKRTFCSIKCKGDWQSKNLSGKNNPNWKPYNPFRSTPLKIRRHILKERKSCEHCGTQINLQVHHINKDRTNNTSRNLLLLCHLCHANEHKNMGNNHVAQLILNHPQSTGRKPHNPKPCKYCKELFHPYRLNLQFCSNSCSVKYRYQTPHKGRICLFCKRTYAYKRKTQKYCSSKCRYSAVSG